MIGGKCKQRIGNEEQGGSWDIPWQPKPIATQLGARLSQA